MQLVSIITFQH